MLEHIGKSLHDLLGRSIDLILPPRCLKCGETVSIHGPSQRQGGAQGGLCATCWPLLTHLGEPCCAICGLPFETEMPAPSLCAACLADPPIFARARAALRYDAGCRDILLGFKHADRTDAAPVLAAWLAQAGKELIAEANLITAVPLHWSRLFLRRYNQAALLAQSLGRRTGKAVDPLLLRRDRATESQGGKNRRRRLANVKSVFSVDPRRRAEISARRVLLIDDVITTGATVNACAEALLAAGAEAVDVLAVARVI